MPNVFDPSQKSGVVASGYVPSGSPLRMSLDDLVDVDDNGAQPYHVLYRRTNGTHGFRPMGFGTILGSYDTELELTTAHPSGAAGGYVVGNDLYIWDNSQWVNVGPFVGPQGDQGDPGVENIIVSPTEPPAPVDESVVWVWLDTSTGG